MRLLGGVRDNNDGSYVASFVFEQDKVAGVNLCISG